MLTFIRNSKRFDGPQIHKQVDQYMRLTRVAIAAFVCGPAGTDFVEILEGIGTRPEGRAGVVMKINRVKLRHREI
jgi:hypothetical protein